MYIFREIIRLIKFFPKGENLLGDAKDNLEVKNEDELERSAGLTKLSKTRWTVRAISFQRILESIIMQQLWSYVELVSTNGTF